MGLRIARHLADMNADYINFSPDHSVTEIIAPKRMIGKSLRDGSRARYGVNVIAIRSGEKSIFRRLLMISSIKTIADCHRP